MTFGKLLYTCLIASSIALPCIAQAHAADPVFHDRSYGKAGAYQPRYTTAKKRYFVKTGVECNSYKVTQWGQSKIVELCGPPLNLGPNMPFVPGSS